MRIPIRSEREAFRLVFASAAVIGVSVVIGWLTRPLVGVAVFAIAAALAAISYLRAEARARLDRSLTWAHEYGLVARGKVGDPSPTTALEDELRDFGADEVIVVTHSRERETWQGELERLRRELDVPVTHVMIGNGSHAST